MKMIQTKIFIFFTNYSYFSIISFSLVNNSTEKAETSILITEIINISEPKKLILIQKNQRF